MELAVVGVLTLKVFASGTELLAVVLAAVLLAARRRTPSSLGYRRPGWRAVATALGVAAGLQLVNVILLVPLGRALGDEGNAYVGAVDGVPALLAVLPLVVFVAPLLEEFLFRGYLFDRIERVVPAPVATTAAVVGTSLLFGLFHLAQGPTQLIGTTLTGFAFAAVYLVSGRNVWASTICHAASNLIALVLTAVGVI